MSRWDNFPMLAREALDQMGVDGVIGEPRQTIRTFPFVSWASANRFSYPKWAEPAYQRCESAAEAFFLRAFVERPGVRLEDMSLVDASGTRVTPQVGVVRSRIDFAVVRGAVRLGVEVDGLTFHQRTALQVSEDYLRARRIMLAGYAVVRFTAQEAFSAAGECWRQLDCILAAMEGHR